MGIDERRHDGPIEVAAGPLRPVPVPAVRPPLIYIAGPYTSGDPVLNTRKAIAEGLSFYELTGCPVVIPHLTMFTHLAFPRPLSYWYHFDQRLVEHCDAVWRLPGESHGADAEVAYAEKLEIPVFRDRDALRRWLSQNHAPGHFGVPT